VKATSGLGNDGAICPHIGRDSTLEMPKNRLKTFNGHTVTRLHSIHDLSLSFNSMEKNDNRFCFSFIFFLVLFVFRKYKSVSTVIKHERNADAT